MERVKPTYWVRWAGNDAVILWVDVSEYTEYDCGMGAFSLRGKIGEDKAVGGRICGIDGDHWAWHRIGDQLARFTGRGGAGELWALYATCPTDLMRLKYIQTYPRCRPPSKAKILRLQPNIIEMAGGGQGQ